MSEKKDYRIEAEVNGSLVLFIDAKDKDEAKEKAEAAIEGGEAYINWDHEGNGTVTLHMPGTWGAGKMYIHEE